MGQIYVVSVELFEAEEPIEVFDIEIEEDQSFIVAGVVVHNSAVCQARDGKLYPLDSGPRPPAHANCRSSTAPIVKSWKEMGVSLAEGPVGVRASMSGAVPASTTYGQWLRKQPAAVQDEVLGVKKGRLFRKGELPIDRFVDRRGNELTLDELKRRESEAWSKAGLG